MKNGLKTVVGTLVLIHPCISMALEDLEGSANEKALPSTSELLGKLTFPSGMKAELFANTPNVQNPTAICFDDSGALYIAETHRFDRGIEDNRRRLEWMRDEMILDTVEDRYALYEKYKAYKPLSYYKKYSEKIRILRDSDGDGKADKAKVFAEGFNNPLDGTAAGIFSFAGDVFFTCIPNLWKLKDTDGDDVADQRQVLQGGFGVSVSLSGHDMNGCAMGPDGRIYFSIGDRGFNFKTKEGNELKDSYAGGVFRCWPDGSEIELVHEGLRNPKELAFDKYGRLFTVDNNADMGDKARVVYIVEGGDSGWHRGHQNLRNFRQFTDCGPWHKSQWMSDQYWEMKGTTRPIRILKPSGFVSKGPSGLTYYPGIGLNKKWEDSFFVCDFIGARSSVIGFKMQPDGAGFSLKSYEPFVSGFLPTDVEFGYDGKVYASDYEGSWPTFGFGNVFTFSDPKELESSGVKEVAGLFKQGFDKLANQRLYELLGHGDLRVRQRAQFTLADRSEMTFLNQAANVKNSIEKRLHGIWGMGNAARKGNGEAVKILEGYLADQSPEIRGQVAKILGCPKVMYKDEDGQLKALLSDSDLNVRMLASISFGRKGESSVQPLLDSAVGSDEDSYLRSGIVEGLVCQIRQNPDQMNVLAANVKHKDVRVREIVLLASGKLKQKLVSKFLEDDSDHIVREAVQMINDKRLDDCEKDLAGSTHLLGKFGSSIDLRILNALFRSGTRQDLERLLTLLEDVEMPKIVRQEVLRSIKSWNKPSVIDPTNGRHRPIRHERYTLKITDVKEAISRTVERSTGDILADAFSSAKELGIEIAPSVLTAKLTDLKAPVQVRIAALEIFSKVAKSKEEIEPMLLKLEKDKNIKIRNAALENLLLVSEERCLDKIRAIFENASLALIERQHAISLLGKFHSEQAKDWLRSLYLDIENQPEKFRLDIIEAAKESKDEKLRALVSKDFDETDMDQKFKNSLVGGDRRRGAQIFYNNAAIQCIQCHQAGRWGVGGTAGPRLNTLRSKGPKYVLESIIYPNAAIASKYAPITLSLKDGTSLSGMFVTEGEDGVTIIHPETKAQVLIEKEKILKKSKLYSSMPPMGHFVTPKDMRDIVKYLSSLGR